LLFDGRPSQPPDAWWRGTFPRYVIRKPLARVELPKSGFVTVTSRNPVVAFEATERRTVRLVELFRVTDTTVMPFPENATVAPLTKFVPVIVMFEALVPRPFEFGLMDVIVGPAVTLNGAVRTTVPPSPFVTVASRDPSGAVLDTSTLIQTCWDVCRAIQFTLIPVPENATLIPVWKFDPVNENVWFVAPRPIVCGQSRVMVGAAVTVNPFASVPVPPSGFVTVTVRELSVAFAATERLTVSELDEFRVTVLTVMPVPEKLTEPPPPTKFDGKFVPLTVTP
jgi:hypothetical protein